MTLTLTQVLRQQNQVLVFGQHVSDFYLRGDLGLGLDPAGPVGFAWIHAFKTVSGERHSLPAPLLLSVHGPGQVAEGLADSKERCWQVDRNEAAVQVAPRRAAWGQWLGLDAG